jgi:hypothetical protein
MKTIGTSLCVAAFLLAGTMAADDKDKAAKQSTEVKQETKTKTGSDTSKTSADIVYGKVESYEPGKSIKVTVPGTVESTKSFDLDEKNTTVHAASNIKTGDWVKVSEKTLNNGHKTITVAHSSEKASRMKKGQ